jgi:hypothetical protein
MKSFIFKLLLYALLIFSILEITVRILHLYTEDPPRFIDEYGVEKRVPNKKGLAVYGNRNQQVSAFAINSDGFNSHREFLPADDKFEVAITGDSFIEGFHQDYSNSLGNKIEERIPWIEVYQYGYAGYDLANQMHLIHSYADDFKKIDAIVIYLNYENDLTRGIYQPNYERIKTSNSTLFRIRDQIKLLAYGSKIGVLEPLKKLVTGKAFQDKGKGYKTNVIMTSGANDTINRDLLYLANFKSLVKEYGFDKEKTVLLLDKRKTSPVFLSYCEANAISYLDYSTAFKSSDKPTTLIYDWHWNDHGRELIAKLIGEYLLKNTHSLAKNDKFEMVGVRTLKQ